ncbi:hypothetical protein [Microvirga makkahensis]|uniref:Uncharacterized protein n=1 Tax=Microvirga makkahensis TaxID=1128670 RepID=A0A7X3MWR5_9HYPH|nr:hypothetical protein [Microvirga makkahensis]MXQ14458.1 hypothetical protein [Microvirga makkahensis]
MTHPVPDDADEIRDFAARHGLSDLAPEHLERMRELADKLASAARMVPRMPSKFDEPAHVFFVRMEGWGKLAILQPGPDPMELDQIV